VIIEEVPIDKVKVGGRYRIDLGDLGGLKASIRSKGLLQPITIDTKKNLLAGERRLKACIDLGHETIPCVIREVEGEVDALEIELIENICRKDMTWQERTLLDKRIYDLRLEQDKDWTLEKQSILTGSSKGSVARRVALADVIEGIPEIGEQDSEEKGWKVYKKLEERMVIQSLKKQEDVSPLKGGAVHADSHYIIADTLIALPSVNGGIAHFAEVDPPYAIDLKKRKGRNADTKQLDMYNEVDEDKYPDFLRIVATETYRVLKGNSFCVWWFGMTWYPVVRDVLREVGFKVNDIPGIWVKGGAGQTASPDTMLASGYEPFFIARKGNPKMPGAGRGNVFSFSPVPTQKKVHPTERPISLMEEIINTFVYPSSIILVPFLGSGVTLRAAYKNNLIGFGYDLDEMNKGRFLDAVYKDQINIHEKE